MLTRVEIAGYRGFKSYRMEGLTRVNLFVGKNNSGKTSLLEGLQFLTSYGDPIILAEVARRRGEVVVHTAAPVDLPVLTDISHFFYGHTLAHELEFKISGDNGYPAVTAKLYFDKVGSGAQTATSRTSRNAPGLFLTIILNKNKTDREDPRYRISSSGGVDIEAGPRLRRAGSRRHEGAATRFVGPDSLNTRAMAAMWDEITIAGQEGDVTGAMRIVDDKLESTHFLTGMLATGLIPSRGGIVVGVKGQEGRVPLGSMGDGIRRLMALAISLAFAKDGCLFVDEIDTGLHYSVMPDMWKLVVTKAMAANSQVFATTHSWDCIAGLSEFCQMSPELMSNVSIHKIDAAIPHSIPFSSESVVRMVKTDIDPRY